MNLLAQIGRRSLSRLELFGDFCRFVGRTHAGILRSATRARTMRLTAVQMYEIGTCSLPVMMTTGLFVGMVLAVQAVVQFKAVGMEGQLGAVVNLSVLRELGPVLAAVLLAGRVGGAMTAELGTMRVTEQIDALRVMAADPVEHLVVPRYLACLLLGPIIVIYADIMGILGGYYVSVHVYKISATAYWMNSGTAIELFDVMSGLLKSVIFSGALALICCHKAFRCRAGAAGVGRACTEAFVASCVVILMLDFFLNVVLNVFYQMQYGIKTFIE